MVSDHTHDGSVGSGGKLDWDNIFSDAVHDHSSDAEGGSLALEARVAALEAKALSEIASGTYTGNDDNNRKIPEDVPDTGEGEALDFTPKIVFVWYHYAGNTVYKYICTDQMDKTNMKCTPLHNEAYDSYDKYIKVIAGGFQVNDGEGTDQLNNSAYTYTWVALG